MTTYKAFIRLCRRAKKCLENERLFILNGSYGKLAHLVEEKEGLIHQVMSEAEHLLGVAPSPDPKARELAATTLREVIHAAEENSIVLSGALRGLRAGQARQSDKPESFAAYTASGEHGQSAPLPKSSEALA